MLVHFRVTTVTQKPEEAWHVIILGAFLIRLRSINNNLYRFHGTLTFIMVIQSMWSDF